MKLIDIKILVYQQCCKMVDERISTIRTALAEAQDAANNETKNSAGDKHETGRAMAQLETEKLSSQLAEVLKLKQTLNHINPNLLHLQVGLGSLVFTNNGNFYIGVSLGKIEIDNEIYFTISPASPIGKKLIDLKSGDIFFFNEKNYTIKELI